VTGQLRALATLLQETTQSCHGKRGLVGPRPCLDNLDKKKSLAPARNWTLDHPAHNLDTIPTMLFWLLISWTWTGEYEVLVKILGKLTGIAQGRVQR